MAGTAASAAVPVGELLKAAETEPFILERDGRLDARRTLFQPEDPIEELLVGAGGRGE